MDILTVGFYAVAITMPEKAMNAGLLCTDTDLRYSPPVDRQTSAIVYESAHPPPQWFSHSIP